MLADVSLAAHGILDALADLGERRVLEEDARPRYRHDNLPHERHTEVVAEEYEDGILELLTQYYYIGCLVKIEEREVDDDKRLRSFLPAGT